MCGRFVLFTTGERLSGAVAGIPGVRKVRAPHGTPEPRFNVAPTAVVVSVRLGGKEHAEALLEPARWGLLPRWKKDESGPTLFNARQETMRAKPSFREAFSHRRCVIPMDGYFEWHEKQPYFVRRADGELLWAAGLWETGLGQLSTTIVTTAGAPPIDWLHGRMPVLFFTSEAARWCTAGAEDAAGMAEVPAAGLRAGLIAEPVSREVGNVANQGAGLIEAIGPARSGD